MTGALGTVLERDGAVYRVATADGPVRAVLRGKAKRGGPRVVVGDVVRLEPEPGGQLFGIVDVEPRRSLLARRVPEGRGARPVAPPVDRPAWGIRTAHYRDPDGNLVEINKPLAR